ncbi:hypothetical protein NQ318_023557 [Aromia moschata]|uniref:Uncharacterized protein n=1 Tax=Aromia moschata TaxID=1265417 RepID=A0AAV8YR09_9CUCU|nr:hypothetical protein NQ318_023557 [Aromia moschata]
MTESPTENDNEEYQIVEADRDADKEEISENEDDMEDNIPLVLLAQKLNQNPNTKKEKSKENSHLEKMAERVNLIRSSGYADENIANQVDEIFIEPPETNVETDEDSADEDEGGMIHNLTGRQLRAPVEVKLIDNFNASTAEVIHEEHLMQRVARISDHLRKKLDCCWIEGDLEPTQHIFPEANYSQYEHLSCVNIFETFFDNEIIEYLVEETKICIFF